MHWLVPFLLMLFILYVVLVVFGLLVFPMFRHRVNWLCYPATLWLLAMAGAVIHLVIEWLAVLALPGEPDWGPVSPPMLASLAFVFIYGPIGVLSFALAFGIRYLVGPSNRAPAPLFARATTAPPTQATPPAPAATAPAPTQKTPAPARRTVPRSPAKKRGIETAIVSICLGLLGLFLVAGVVFLILGGLLSHYTTRG